MQNKRTYTITPRASEFGGGFTLLLLNNGVEEGRGIYPECDLEVAESAYDMAVEAGEEWSARCDSGILNSGEEKNPQSATDGFQNATDKTLQSEKNATDEKLPAKKDATYDRKAPRVRGSEGVAPTGAQVRELRGKMKQEDFGKIFFADARTVRGWEKEETRMHPFFYSQGCAILKK